MSIDIANEQLLTLKDASSKLPRKNGKKIHHSTIFRWAQRGRRGIRLETIRLGRTIWTSLEALQRFADRLTEIESPNHLQQYANVSTRNLTKQHKLSTARLQRAGFKTEVGRSTQ